ncbi:protein of unknown function [Acetitomaculum ruminis DSM 5522]|uniref:Prolow-density lipoprotein receptor-related protein 1-like beta-propeller domain-containing protein n=1 Tax=Acetitomaculum ruminis DSM 5522 TaxID=1120918 RepID=A0A1I0XSA0_9FIRM|nr:DUF5050 domain-containing protein [Acetitomaculum ruminis]SFB03935.1 protein of unknown function [Acetitomaculum ruminis DSM 5522]
MKKTLAIIISVLLVIALVLIGYQSYQSSLTVFNDDDANGNTSGNLNNLGLFCEYEGKVYFSNPDDKGRLYCMNPDESEPQKMSNDYATSINAYGNYVFYTIGLASNPDDENATKDSTNSFLGVSPKAANYLTRVDIKDGKNRLVLDDEPSMKAALIGNYIYYIHYESSTYSNLYKVKIDGEEQEKLNNEPINTAGAFKHILYTNTEGTYQKMLLWDTTQNSIKEIFDGDVYYCSSNNGTEIYYMDCDNGYGISKLDLTTNKVTKIVTDRIENFNLTNNYIYYQKNDPEVLCRCDLDGKNEIEIAKGYYQHINVTSQYIYFSDFSKRSSIGTIYHASVKRPQEVSVFSPGGPE